MEEDKRRNFEREPCGLAIPQNSSVRLNRQFSIVSENQFLYMQ